MKIYKNFKICFLILTLIISSLYSISIENDHIRLNVGRDDGVFNLGTVDDEPLVDGYPDAFAGNNFKILYDGYIVLTNELGHTETAPLRDTTLMMEEGIITTEWVFDDLIFWQKLRFIEEDSLETFLNVEVFIYNEGADSHTVGMQYFMDLNIGGNDNPVMAVPWETIENETRYEDDDIPGYILAYQDIEHHDSTGLFGMGLLYGSDMIMPDEVLFSNADNLGNISMDHPIASNPIEDSGMLLHWNDVMLHPTGILIIEFNWGLPFSGFSDVDEGFEIVLPQNIAINSYPNPFNSKANITISGKLDGEYADLSLYNIYGRKVETIFAGNSNGRTSFIFEPKGLSSGTYLILLESDKGKTHKKIEYIK